MATEFAVQPSVYEAVSRASRQRRAAGRREPRDAGYTAYRAGLDVAAARSLQARQIALSEDVAKTNEELAREQLALRKEAIEDQAAAAKVSGAVSLASTGAQIYSIFKPAPAVTAPAATTVAPASGAQAVTSGASAQAATSGAAVTPGAGAAVAGETASSFAPGTAGGTMAGGAGALAVELTKAPVQEWAQDTFGGEAEDVVGVAARFGQGAAIGAGIGGGYGALIGGAVGAVVGVVEEVADGSHICTAANNEHGLDRISIEAMRMLKEYADKNHAEEIGYYLENCPAVLSKMQESGELSHFLLHFKEYTIPKLVELIKAGDMEAAYSIYRQKTEQIFIKYDPDYSKDQFLEAL